MIGDARRLSLSEFRRALEIDFIRISKKIIKQNSLLIVQRNHRVDRVGRQMALLTDGAQNSGRLTLLDALAVLTGGYSHAFSTVLGLFLDLNGADLALDVVVLSFEIVDGAVELIDSRLCGRLISRCGGCGSGCLNDAARGHHDNLLWCGGSNCSGVADKRDFLLAGELECHGATADGDWLLLHNVSARHDDALSRRHSVELDLLSTTRRRNRHWSDRLTDNVGSHLSADDDLLRLSGSRLHDDLVAAENRSGHQLDDVSGERRALHLYRSGGRNHGLLYDLNRLVGCHATRRHDLEHRLAADSRRSGSELELLLLRLLENDHRLLVSCRSGAWNRLINELRCRRDGGDCSKRRNRLLFVLFLLESGQGCRRRLLVAADRCRRKLLYLEQVILSVGYRRPAELECTGAGAHELNSLGLRWWPDLEIPQIFTTNLKREKRFES